MCKTFSPTDGAEGRYERPGDATDGRNPAVAVVYRIGFGSDRRASIVFDDELLRDLVLSVLQVHAGGGDKWWRDDAPASGDVFAARLEVAS